MILLTNQRTESAAEMLVMALRENSRATIVGESTAGALFGKDTAELVGTDDPIPNGSDSVVANGP
jgi:C-terminal processing protease CtpA/Prc